MEWFFFLEFVRSVNQRNTQETWTKPALGKQSLAQLYVCTRIGVETSSDLSSFVSCPVYFTWPVGEKALPTGRERSRDL